MLYILDLFQIQVDYCNIAHNTHPNIGPFHIIANLVRLCHPVQIMGMVAL